MSAPEHKPGTAGKPQIFVVDDEPMLLELAATILEPLGFSTVRFRSGEAAVKAFEDAPVKPVLIITDYAMGMNSMTGLDLVAACRKVAASQKILLLSGTVNESITKDAPSKPDSFLAKPYRPQQFVSIVRALIEI